MATLLSIARHAFTDLTRRRGREYFDRGHVEVANGATDADGLVKAWVRGSLGTHYLVQIDRRGVEDRGELVVSCDCPYFADGRPCKHIYAVMYASEDQFDARQPVHLVLEVPQRERDQDEFFLKGFDSERPWRRDLNQVRRVMQSSRRPDDIEHHRPHRLSFSLAVELSRSLGRLAVEVFGEPVLASGRSGKPHPFSPPQELEAIVDPLDRAAVALLLEHPTTHAQEPTSFFVTASRRTEVLQALVATRRFTIGSSERPATIDPLAWTPELVVADNRVDARLLRGEETRSLRAVSLVLEDGTLVMDDAVGGLTSGRGARLLEHIARHGPLTFVDKEADLVVAELSKLPSLPERIHFDERLSWTATHVETVPQASLRTHEDGRSTVGTIRFLYGDIAVPLGDDRAALVDPEGRRFLLRRPDQERRAVARLSALGVKQEVAGRPGVQISSRRLPAAIGALVDTGWWVEAEGMRYRAVEERHYQVVSGIDWFDVRGEMRFGETVVPLPTLLEAAAKNQTEIPLEDGSVGVLTGRTKRLVDALLALGKHDRQEGAIRFEKSQAAFLDLLLSAEAEVEADQQFRRVRDNLRRAQKVTPIDAPDQFAGELRGYQKEGIGWLRFLEEIDLGGILADDMGLGKTVQVIALLAGAARRPSMVVAPKSLVHNWITEAARFAPELSVLDYTGPGRSPDEIDGYDLVVTTYGTVRRDVTELRKRRFHYLILDEAQAVKNPSSQSSKACRLLDGYHRLALTGTPVENHPIELWSIFEFLNPRMLGPRRKFASLISEDDAAGIGRALRPLILRRTKEQVLPELPEKTEMEELCELEGPQRRHYDELRDHYRRSLLTRGPEVPRVEVLEALLRLRQAACHSGLVDPSRVDEPSAKLETLMAHLEEVTARGHKALVFSQFVALLQIVKKQVEAANLRYEYLDGKTRDRAERIANFMRDPEVNLFLISLKAGGLGLNLTAADYVFILDPWWNPAVEAQAIDRAHRIGQTRPVFAYRLIAKDTVEEKILALAAKKRRLAEALVAAEADPLSKLTLEDLELLLS